MMEPRAMTAPPRWRTFESTVGHHLLVLELSQVYDISLALYTALADRDAEAETMLQPMLAQGRQLQLDTSVRVAPQSISLNVSSSCNLACTYCYAGRGGFAGAQSGAMSWETARAAVDCLLASCDREAPATIGFMGGEPFVNRPLIHRIVRYTTARGRALGQVVQFSVTTNGTLLQPDDIDLMRHHPFAVTVSIDGGREIQAVQRVGTDFDCLVTNLQPLLSTPGQAKVTARATVTRHNLSLIERYDAIRALGFSDIGFSPVRVGTPGEVLRQDDWPPCLQAYVDLGAREVQRLIDGQGTAFSNLVIALRQIHRGACSPYPCGAGGGYFSVSTDGTWYACHRAIGNADFALGNNARLDTSKRETFLQLHHVHRQVPCQTCWARYLCSGSCHQEAMARSTASCDFIRGWLDFCLSAYCTLLNQRPHWFYGEYHGSEFQVTTA
jgi:uncharacterized protein